MIDEETVIDHELRGRLGISLNEYVVLNAIHKHGHKSLRDLSKAFDLSKATVKNIINKLEKRGYVKRVFLTDPEAMEALSAKFGRSGCVVCGSGFLMEAHHYPIRRKDGGKRTVFMCREHHIEFHRLTDYGTIFSQLQIALP